MTKSRLITSVALSAALSGAMIGAPSAQQVVTVVSFGGTYQDAERKAYYEPTAKQLGFVLKEDSLKGIADVRLQVQSGKPTWDVIEVGVQYCMADEAKDLFEPLDFNVVVNAKDLGPLMKGERWVAGGALASMVLVWNKEKYGNNPPKTWGDFFDVQKFPGSRAMYNQSRMMLEVALMGDGVAPDKVYPIDVDRAFKKLNDFQKNIRVFYTSHGQSVQLVKDKEVDMLAMLNGRAAGAIKDGAKYDFTFVQGVIFPGCWAIPKGAPNKAAAMKVINAFISADIQANLPKHYDYGPINAKAFETGKITPAEAKVLNSSPENLKLQVIMDAGWWAQNEAKIQPRWDSFLQK